MNDLSSYQEETNIKNFANTYRELFFTYGGLGDNILLHFAAQEYYKKYNKKLLLGLNYRELFKNCFCAEIIEGFSFHEMNNPEIFPKKMAILDKYGILPVFVNAGYIRKLNDGSDKAIAWYPDKHIAAKICERVGISGKISIAPHIRLNEEEKRFGRFFKDNQIAIMSNGLQKYKTLNIDKLQAIVNKLKPSYNFIQIGLPADERIAGTLDKRGEELRKVAAILHNSDLFICPIGGLMHLARAVNCRSIVLYSNAEPLYFDSYPCNINIAPRAACDLCGRNLRHPQQMPCFNNYACINKIDIHDAIHAINKYMQKNSNNEELEVENITIHSDKAGMQDFFSQKQFNFYRDARYRYNYKNKNIEEDCYISILGMPMLKITRRKTYKTVYLFNIFPIYKKKYEYTAL